MKTAQTDPFNDLVRNLRSSLDETKHPCDAVFTRAASRLLASNNAIQARRYRDDDYQEQDSQ